MCRKIKFWTLAGNFFQFFVSLIMSYTRICRQVIFFSIVVGPSYIDDLKANFLWCSARSTIMSKCSANCHIMIIAYITIGGTHKINIFLHFNAFSISFYYQRALYAYIYVLLRLWIYSRKETVLEQWSQQLPTKPLPVPTHCSVWLFNRLQHFTQLIKLSHESNRASCSWLIWLGQKELHKQR